MKRTLSLVSFGMIFFLSCNHSATLSEQMKLNFANHLKKIDSSAVLDSFRILQIDTIVEKLGRKIEDTIYKLELHRVEAQLANAVRENKKDSISIYQYEINYMMPQIDSVTNSISKGDSKKIYGFIMRCVYQIRKNNLSVKDSNIYFFDNGMNILNLSFTNTDSFILKSLKKVH